MTRTGEMIDSVSLPAASYNKALHIISEYVETELYRLNRLQKNLQKKKGRNCA